MKNTTTYKKWNVAFFAVFIILFVIPCIKFELEGIMTGTTRIFLGSMILLLVYGLVRSIISLKSDWKLKKVEFINTDMLEAE